MQANEHVKIVEQWLADLSRSLGTDLSLDEEGLCSFQLDEERIITIEVPQDRAQVYLYTPLLALPSQDPELAGNLMTKALALNAFQIASGGASIGLVPGQGLFVLSYLNPIDRVDSERFNQLLGLFLETATDLKKLLMDVSHA